MKFFFATPLVIFLFFMLIFMAKMFDSDVKTVSGLLNKPLPDFVLQGVDGSSAIDTKQLKGQYYLLNIFASWCLPCRIEHPFLMELAAKKELPVYGVNWNDKPESLASFLKEKGNPYKLIGDDQKGEVVVSLGVTGAPETFLVSPEGIVVFHYQAPLNADIYNTQIKPIISQK